LLEVLSPELPQEIAKIAKERTREKKINNFFIAFSV